MPSYKIVHGVEIVIKTEKVMGPSNIVTGLESKWLRTLVITNLKLKIVLKMYISTIIYEYGNHLVP